MDDTGTIDQRQTTAPTVAAIFLGFLRLGATAFGGPAMVAYIRILAVERHRWLDEPAFRRGVALCQAIPGATAMQVAAYVGLRARGFRGSLASYIGFGLPAFCLMLLLSYVYLQTRSMPLTAEVFHGLRAMVVALVANAAWNFAGTSAREWRAALLSVAAAIGFLLDLNPILVVGACAIAAVLLLNSAADGRGRDEAAPFDPRLLRSALCMAGAASVALILLFAFVRPFFDLALTMLRVDIVAFGGGFASVPLMQHWICDVQGWMTSRTFMDGIALGQITPGPIVITATFAGYVISGIPGALVGTVSVFLPSFLLVAVLAPRFERLQRHRWFRAAMRGALVSFVGLLAAVTLRFGLAMTWTAGTALVAAAAFVALRRRVDVLWVVLGAVGVSLALAAI